MILILRGEHSYVYPQHQHRRQLMAEKSKEKGVKVVATTPSEVVLRREMEEWF